MRARSVVIASGARYRRPAIADLARFEGRGVWYWASPIEAKLCAGQEVIAGRRRQLGRPGGGLPVRRRAKVRMMVRGDGLADSMSRYLIDRIAARRQFELMTHTEIVGLDGPGRPGWSGSACATRATGAETEPDIRMSSCSSAPIRPPAGSTAAASKSTRPASSSPARRDAASPLETSVPGVFAVGDVRSGSVKRVGAAIGEGAQVVAALHGYLRRRAHHHRLRRGRRHGR